MFTNHWDSEFPERDKVHSPMASDFRSGALGEGRGEIAPCKGQKSYVSSRAFFTFAPNRAHHAGDAYPGCRLTPFALPWAMHSLGFQPATHYKTNWELVELVRKL